MLHFTARIHSHQSKRKNFAKCWKRWRMTNFLTIILSLSLAATLLFGAIRCLNKFGFPIEGIYRLEKLVSLFYLLPAIFIVSVFGQICLTDIRTLSLYTEDFSYVSQFGDSWKLSLLKYDTVLQNLADWIHYFFRSWFTSLHYHFKWHIKTMPAHRGGLPMGMYECY